MEVIDSFDRVMDAFGHRYRRRLLLALSEHNPQDEDDTQESKAALGDVHDDGADSNATPDPDIVETAMFHEHLPKLEDYGYITWDRKTGDIAKGPDWDEIAPIIELLVEYEDELPEDWL